jgi:hypothetical protein
MVAELIFRIVTDMLLIAADSRLATYRTRQRPQDSYTFTVSNIHVVAVVLFPGRWHLSGRCWRYAKTGMRVGQGRNDLHAEVKRQRGDQNPCGQSPMNV